MVGKRNKYALAVTCVEGAHLVILNVLQHSMPRNMSCVTGMQLGTQWVLLGYYFSSFASHFSFFEIQISSI
jgi:hypothetical protein